MIKDEVKKLRMDSPESLQFLNNATKFYNLMMMYRCAIREIQTKLEVLDDEFSAENNRNPISFIKTRIKKPNSIYDKLQKMGYEFTTEWVQKKNRFGEDVSFKKYYLLDMVAQNMSRIPRID